jgi:hypothetical protein
MDQEIDLTRMKQRIRGMSPTLSEFDVRFDVDGQPHEVALEKLPDGVVTFSLSAAWLSA